MLRTSGTSHVSNDNKAISKARLMKRLALILSVLLVALGFVILSLPFALSTHAVKQAISSRISDLTGYAVTLNGEADIQVFPFLNVSFSAVSVRDRSTFTSEPLISMDRLDVSLNFVALLRGEIDAKQFTFYRPHLRLSLTDAQPTPLTALGSHPLFTEILQEIGQSKQLDLEAIVLIGGDVLVDRDEIVTSPSQPSRSASPPIASDHVTDINAALSISGSKNALTLSGSLKWNNEAVRYQINASDLYGFSNGDVTGLGAKLSSDIFELSFEGQALSKADLLLSGELSAKTTSAGYMANWLGLSSGRNTLLGPFTLKGALSGTLQRFSMSDVSLAIDGNTGDGALNFAFGDANPVVTGTIAFESLDVSPYLYALGQPAVANQHWTTIRLSEPAWASLSTDIRFSASEVTYQDMQLGDLAAALRIHDRIIELDIVSLSLMDGQISGAVSTSFAGKPVTRLTMRLTDLSSEELSQALFDRPVFTGRFSAETNLEANGRFLGDQIRALSGSLTLEIKGGVLNDFDLTALDDALKAGDLPKPDAYLDDNTPVDSLEARVSFADGFARLEEILLRSKKKTVTLAGESDLITLGLSGKGIIRDHIDETKETNGTEADGDEPRPFSVTGRWDHPIITPDLRYLLQRRREAWQ